MTLTEEVALYLDAQVEALTFDKDGTTGNTFLDGMPSSPDTAVMIEAHGGPALDYEAPTLHLLVRGDEALAQQIYDTLTAIDGVTLPGGTYVVGCVGVQAAPVHMGADENGRQEYSINVQFVTE